MLGSPQLGDTLVPTLDDPADTDRGDESLTSVSVVRSDKMRAFEIGRIREVDDQTQLDMAGRYSEMRRAYRLESNLFPLDCKVPTSTSSIQCQRTRVRQACS